MRLERQQRELTNNAVEEQALQDTRIRTEPESLPIQARIRIRTIVRTSTRKCGETEKESFFKWRTS